MEGDLFYNSRNKLGNGWLLVAIALAVLWVWLLLEME